jgi:hypothetical protein
MRYKIKIAYREVLDPEGERTIHQTSSQYDKPIFMYDNNDEANARGVGLGSQVFGPGHYTSQNPVVSRGYKSFLPIRREEVMPRGTRIFDYDNPTNEELLAVINAYKSKYKHPAKVNQLFERCSEGRFKVETLARQLSEWQPDDFTLGGFSASSSPKKIAPIEDVRRRLNFIITELGFDAIEYRAFTNHPKADSFFHISDEEREVIIDFVIKNKKSIVLQNMDQQDAWWYLDDVLNDPDKVYNLYQSFAKLSNFDHEGMLKRNSWWQETYKNSILDYISKIAVENHLLERDSDYTLEKSFENKQRKINRALRKHESAKNILITNRAILTMPDIFEKIRFDPDSLTDEEKARYEDETRTTKKEYYTELLGKDAPIKLTLLEISDLIDAGVDPKLLQSQLRFRSDFNVTQMNFIQKYKILKNLYPYFGDKILRMLFTSEELEKNKLLLRVYLGGDFSRQSDTVRESNSNVNNLFINWVRKAVKNYDKNLVECPNCRTLNFGSYISSNSRLVPGCFNCNNPFSVGYEFETYNDFSLEDAMSLLNTISYINQSSDVKNLSLIINAMYKHFINYISNLIIQKVTNKSELDLVLSNEEFIKNMTDGGYGHLPELISSNISYKAAFNYKKYKLVLGK